MTKRFVTVLKYISLSVVLLLGVISCEKDFKNVGVNLVDNNIFSTEKYTSDIIAFSEKTDSVRSSNLNDFLLGVQSDVEFGKLEASIVSQLSLETENPDFGLNAVIDTVIVDIPYRATLKGRLEDNIPDYALDSIWTKGESSFNLNVFELGTFLHNLDPLEPTKTKVYYSRASFVKKNPATPLYSGLFSPNKNDTMLVVKRFKYPNDNFPDLVSKEEYKTDTIKKTDAVPSIKIPLNKEMIKTIIQDNAQSNDFSSNQNFQHFFKGLYFEALEQSSADYALMNLELKEASMTIYFSFDEQKDEKENEDLNDNGVNGETDVWVRTPKSFTFPFLGVKSNILTRDWAGSNVAPYINTANTTDGEEKLFVQGASGTTARLKLFGEDTNGNEIPDELETLRSNNWLINEAKLEVYIDPANLTNWTPQRLYLYNVASYEDEDDTQLLDAMPQSLLGINGNVIYDADNNPEKYSFLITDYISELLKPDSEVTLHDLGIKVFDPHDTPDPRYMTDTIIKKYDANPKGLVLKGNLFPTTDKKRIKLEIYYTKKN